MSHIEDFKTNGYTVIRKFFSEQEIELLRPAIADAQAKADEKSRLDKGGLFFKHNLFRRSDAVRQFISQRKIVHLLRGLAGGDIWCRWDQTVDKAPGGEEFPWHQDNGYNGLENGHFQLWIALSEMTKENGGLWVQRGSHLDGRRPHTGIGNHIVCPGNEADAEFVGAEAGDVVLFSSFTLHRTLPNTTKKPRVAYVIEYMSMSHFDPYIESPYFVVARNGESAPGFVRWFKGRLNPLQQLKYVKPRLERRIRSLRGRLSKTLRRNADAKTA